jgi:hypothetical protein
MPGGYIKWLLNEIHQDMRSKVNHQRQVSTDNTLYHPVVHSEHAARSLLPPLLALQRLACGLVQWPCSHLALPAAVARSLAPALETHSKAQKTQDIGAPSV